MSETKFPNTPMMSEREVKIIDDLIEEHQSKYCLEWGSGGSTLYFPKKHKCIKHWLSIEHLGTYCEYYEKDLDPKVSIIWTHDENNWYFNCVRYHVRKYDFILIDGLYRKECLDIAKMIVNNQGIILLHDSGRAEYRSMIKAFGRSEKLCEGETPARNGGFVHRGLTKFWI